MRRYYEILDRANRGPYLTEEQWDLEKVAMTTRHLVEKYKLSWNPSCILPRDGALADAVFEAGMELAESLGVYCRDTKRVIQFDPQGVGGGGGGPAVMWWGNAGAPIPERYYLEYVMVYAQEPIVDLLNPGSLTTVDGFEVRTGGPMGIAACLPQ